jgi:outer membrane protein OmpA-like peptidoglycan-associated protein
MPYPLRRVLTGPFALALLAACAPDPTRPSFNGEAGQAASGGFGNATRNNALIHSGELSYAASLSGRFASDVPTTVNFAFNSAELDAEARRVLAAQAAFIRQFPEVRFSVTGHADLVGSERYNYALGLRRAQAAVAFLVSQGVEVSRLEALVSEGETRPVVPSGGPERANRRAVTDVMGFVQDHPLVLNGKYAEIVFRDYVLSAEVPSTLDAAGETTVAGAAAGG